MAMQPHPGPPRRRRAPLRRAASAVLTAAGIVYFLLDALALHVLAPFLRWLGRQPLVRAVERRVASLGPYPTLVLVLVPLVLLEPLKLAGAYLLAMGSPAMGLALIVGGEALKIVTVERLFRFGRPKLLTIPWFAWLYRHAAAFMDRLRASHAWRMAARAAALARSAGRGLLRRARRALLALLRPG
ncbi:hypothetical protein [Arenibaculum pallidiluteum]|uniref:hypothetical protein n=1 Tax=Arenibaculum pallidiluteum TaxID=2812559 RepID=UPI001A97A49B|nr:hypothetical protein [Arenibaculum pallidiluteum]